MRKMIHDLLDEFERLLENQDVVQCTEVASLIRILESEPLEDGVTHSGETALAAFLEQHPNTARELLPRVILETAGVGASMMRLLGRIEEPLAPEWRAELVRQALMHQNVEIRDAAVQCAEVWAGPDRQRAMQNAAAYIYGCEFRHEPGREPTNPDDWHDILAYEAWHWLHKYINHVH